MSPPIKLWFLISLQLSLQLFATLIITSTATVASQFATNKHQIIKNITNNVPSNTIFLSEIFSPRVLKKRSAYDGRGLYELDLVTSSSFHSQPPQHLALQSSQQQQQQQQSSQSHQPSIAFTNVWPIKLVVSKQFGGILPCTIKFNVGSSTSGDSGPASIIKIVWEQRDVRSLDDSHFTPANDVPGLREFRSSDGSLAFLPSQATSGVGSGISQSGSGTNAGIDDSTHQALYRCIATTSLGTIVSPSVHVIVGSERRDLVVRVHDSSTMSPTPGNDAQLRCSVNSDLWRVAAWITDDGDIYRPLSDANEYIATDRRHFVLPTSGDLLIGSVRQSDTRRQFRCRVVHLITGQTLDSINFGRIKLSSSDNQASHISYRPRFNLNASLRQTLLAIPDSPLDLYCSFDAQPPANLSWHFIAFNDKTQRSQPLNSPQLNSESGSRRVITERHLRILRPSPEDLGTYVCVANNTQFEVRHESDVLMASVLTLNLTASSTNPLPGDSLWLSCGIADSVSFDLTRILTGSRLIVAYQWLHNGVPLFSSDDTNSNTANRKYHQSSRHYYPNRIEKTDPNTVKIVDVKPEDAGVYQCLIRLTGPPDFELTLTGSQVVRIRSTPARITSHFAEQVLVPDTEVALRCTAQGIPAPRIIWQRNGQNLTDISGNFATNLVMDSSLYRYKTATILLSASSLASSGLTSAAQTSSDYDQRRFATVSYLNISSIRAQDAGLFCCVAFNGAGSQTHQSRISVIGQPYVHPIGDVVVTQGEPITVPCPFSGYPIDEVYFTRSGIRLPAQIDRQSLPTMGVLYLSAADAATDSGDYSCVAVGGGNEGATTRAEQHFRLTVVVPPVLSPLLFSDVLEEGMRATSVCSVVSGEPPITLQWLKDGAPLLQGAGSVSSSSSLHHHHQRPDPHVQVFNLNEFTHSLIINNITRRHEGVYTCLATTPTTSANRSAQLKVKAAPRFLIRPASQVSIVNSFNQQTRHQQLGNVRFDCLANGSPQPVVRWKYLRPRHDSGTGNIVDDKNQLQHFDAVPILSSPQIHVLENGSLTIRASDKSKYVGVYLCEASNGVGRVIESRASLSIVHSPEVSLKILPSQLQPEQSSSESELIKVALRRDSQISLFCTGTGPLPLSVSWYKNGREINVFGAVPEPVSGGASLTASGTFRVFDQTTSSSVNSGSGERTANLVLKHITRSDNGHYVCQARNGYGTASRGVLLQVLEAPDPPEGLKATEVGARSVTLTWSLGFTGNLPLLSQNIEYKRESAKSWHNALMVKSNSNTVSVHGLSPLTSYEFRVAFTNELGNSEHSRSITLTTQMEAPTVMPDSVRATPLSSRSVRLTWTVRVPAPDSSEVEIIDGFYLGYRVQSAEPAAYTYKTISNQPLQYGKNTAPNTGHFRSNPTVQGPTAAFLIKLQSTNSRFVDLNTEHLTPKSGPGSYIHQYYEHVIEGLTRQSQYLFVVQAFNEKGAGPTSVETTAKTFAHDPPSAPTARIDNVSAHEAVLSWEHSSTEAELPLLVDGYVISYRITGSQPDNLFVSDNTISSPDSTATSDQLSHPADTNAVNNGGLIGDDWQSVTVNFQPTAGSSSSFTIRNLRCGTEYVARIEAFNEMGSGSPSELVRFSTSGGVPIPPDKRSQFVVSNITSVSLNFALWQDNGCSISGYAVRYRPRRSPQTSTSGRTSNASPSIGQWVTLSTHLLPEREILHIRDLVPGTWHDLMIVAINDAGRRESDFRFATLTELGATVEPLHAYDSRMSTGSSISLSSAILEDPMILIPTLCTIIVLLVVTATSAFLYVMRVKQDSMMAMNEDTYCRHRAPSSSGRQTTDESMSLSSYPSNCHQSQKTLKNGSGIYEKPLGSIGMLPEPEPLYEATTQFGKAQQTLAYHPSPSQQQRIQMLQKLSSNENILDQVMAIDTQGGHPQNFYGYTSGFETLHHQQQQQQQHLKIKTLQRQAQQQQQQPSNGSGNSTHLYQMPIQQQQQQQQNSNEAAANDRSEGSFEDSLIEIGPPPPPPQAQLTSASSAQSYTLRNSNVPSQLPTPYMTSFGPLRRGLPNDTADFQSGFQTHPTN